MNETQTRWTKREQQLTSKKPAQSEILDAERRNVFERNAIKRNDAARDEAKAEMSPAQRLTQRGQQKSEGSRNRFGDPQQGGGVDPREKFFTPTPGKRTAATEWHGKPVQRSNSGRPLDAETLRLKEAADADRIKRMSPANRAKFGLPQNDVPVQKPHLTEQDVQAFVLFLAAAHTEWPIDERRGPNDGSEADQRYRAAVVHNAHQLRKMWDWLVYKNLAQLDLTGLLLAFSQCEQGRFLDNGQARKRGFGNDELINVVAEPPHSALSEALGATSQNAVDEVFALIKSGRARLERQRPATQDESAQIQADYKKPFHELAREVRQGYKK